jgi:hypothetical protein
MANRPDCRQNPRDFVVAGAHTPRCGPLLLPHCTPVRPRVEAPREMTMHLLFPRRAGAKCVPIPAATAPPNLPPQWWCSIAQCIAHRASTPEARWPQINPQGRCLGPPDTALLHVCGPPRPGVANRPSSGACCVGLGHGQWGARRRGSRGQQRVTYQRTRLIKPRSASHGKAAAMRARIAGTSITHSSNKAWRTGGDEFGPSICGRAENG